MNTTIQTFNFNGLPVAVIDHNQEAWMSGDDVGKALEYNDPRDSISKIFERKRDELEEYSVTVKLTATDGKLYNTRVYNEEGVMLISMFSNQPKAKAFRRWAVQVLKQHRQRAVEETIPMRDYLALQTKHIALQEKLLATPKASKPAITTGQPWTAAEDAKAIELRAQGYGYTRIGFVLGRTGNGVKHRFVRALDARMQGMEQGDLFGGEQ